MKNLIFSCLIGVLLAVCFIHCKPQTSDSQENSNLDSTQIQPLFNLGFKRDTLIYSPNPDNVSVVKIANSTLPLQRIIVLSSSAVAYLESLDGLSNIITVYGAEWMYSPKLHQLIQEGKIKSGGAVNTINLEEIIAQNPDAVITYSDPTQNKLYQALQKFNIPIIFIDEFKEQTPLNKSAYLKVFGALIEKQPKADSLFNLITNNYNRLKEKAQKKQNKPTVFTEIMRGDIWYMPGGKSFVASYLKDAGANYLWADDTTSQTIPLNFEQVVSKAQTANFWVNASDFSNREQLQNSFPNYNLFKAFQSDEVYNYIKRRNAKGANDYFETGTVRCDWVLRDLVKIFYPNELPNDSLYFYRRIP